jgi:hypothetical protein
VLCHCGIEVRVDHSGLDDGDLVVRADLDDPVHELEGQHDTARRGVRATGHTRPGTPADDRHVVARRPLQEDLHVLDGPRTDDGDGQGLPQDRPLVTGVLREVRSRRGDASGKGRDQFLEDGRVDHDPPMKRRYRAAARGQKSL